MDDSLLEPDDPQPGKVEEIEELEPEPEDDASGIAGPSTSGSRRPTS